MLGLFSVPTHNAAHIYSGFKLRTLTTTTVTALMLWCGQSQSQRSRSLMKAIVIHETHAMQHIEDVFCSSKRFWLGLSNMMWWRSTNVPSLCCAWWMWCDVWLILLIHFSSSFLFDLPSSLLVTLILWLFCVWSIVQQLLILHQTAISIISSWERHTKKPHTYSGGGTRDERKSSSIGRRLFGYEEENWTAT